MALLVACIMGITILLCIIAAMCWIWFQFQAYYILFMYSNQLTKRSHAWISYRILLRRFVWGYNMVEHGIFPTQLFWIIRNYVHPFDSIHSLFLFGKILATKTFLGPKSSEGVRFCQLTENGVNDKIIPSES